MFLRLKIAFHFTSAKQGCRLPPDLSNWQAWAWDLFVKVCRYHFQSPNGQNNLHFSQLWNHKWCTIITDETVQKLPDFLHQKIHNNATLLLDTESKFRNDGDTNRSVSASWIILERSNGFNPIPYHLGHIGQLHPLPQPFRCTRVEGTSCLSSSWNTRKKTW